MGRKVCLSDDCRRPHEEVDITAFFPGAVVWKVHQVGNTFIATSEEVRGIKIFGFDPVIWKPAPLWCQAFQLWVPTETDAVHCYLTQDAALAEAHRRNKLALASLEYTIRFQAKQLEVT